MTDTPHATSVNPTSPTINPIGVSHDQLIRQEHPSIAPAFQPPLDC
jgi:hypothetical protein